MGTYHLKQWEFSGIDFKVHTRHRKYYANQYYSGKIRSTYSWKLYTSFWVKVRAVQLFGMSLVQLVGYYRLLMY